MPFLEKEAKERQQAAGRLYGSTTPLEHGVRAPISNGAVAPNQATWVRDHIPLPLSARTGPPQPELPSGSAGDLRSRLAPTRGEPLSLVRRRRGDAMPTHKATPPATCGRERSSEHMVLSAEQRSLIQWQ